MKSFPFLCLLFAFFFAACSPLAEIHLGALQHFNRGNDFLSQRLYKQAIHEYQSAIALEEGQEAYHYNLGLAYFNLLLYEQAQDAYQRALDLNPKLAEAWYNLSLVYNKLDQPDEAYMAYEKYQTLNRIKAQAQKKVVQPKPQVLSGPGLPPNGAERAPRR